MKKVAIIQSNYIPWKGYFDMIAAVDHFVFLDDVQYTRRDWRNRNKIMTPRGPVWLSIPVDVSGKFEQTVRQVKIAEREWADHHLKSLIHSYSKAAHFSEYKDWLSDLYSKASEFEHLSQINQFIIAEICQKLKIETKLHDCCEFEMLEGKSERLMSLCKALGADVYVSGPAAQCYMNEDVFKENNMSVEWFQYPKYSSYDQLHNLLGNTEHGVSVLDLLFNTGADARKFMRETQKV